MVSLKNFFEVITLCDRWACPAPALCAEPADHHDHDSPDGENDRLPVGRDRYRADQHAEAARERGGSLVPGWPADHASEFT